MTTTTWNSGNWGGLGTTTITSINTICPDNTNSHAGQGAGGNNIIACIAGPALPTGKAIYWEVTVNGGCATATQGIFTYTAFVLGMGVSTSSNFNNIATTLGSGGGQKAVPSGAYSFIYYSYNNSVTIGISGGGDIVAANSGTPANTVWANGSVVGFAYNQPAQTMQFYLNGTAMWGAWSVAGFAGQGALYPLAATWSGGRPVATINDGTLAFAHSVPSGFVSLASANGGGSTGVAKTSMTSIAVTVTPNPVISGQPYSFKGVATGGPWSATSSVQLSSQVSGTITYVTPPSPEILSLSTDGLTATITGITSGVTSPHTAYMQDSVNNIQSPGVVYNVNATGVTATTVAVNNAAFRFSPGYWVGDTGRGGSVSRTCWNVGSWFSLTWTASASPGLSFLMTSTNSTQLIDWVLNGTLTQGQALTTPITGVTPSAVNTIRVYVSNNGGTYGHLTVTGATIDGNSTVGTAPAAQPWGIFIGDEVTEAGGLNNANGYVYTVASTKLTTYDVVNQSSNGGGWIRAGEGGVGYYPISGAGLWDLIDYNGGTSTSILDTNGIISSYGAISTPPAFIAINLGDNDGSLHGDAATTAQVTAAVTNVMTALRAKTSASCLIFIIIPFSLYTAAVFTDGATYVTAIKTGFNNYKTANPSDTKVALIDGGTTAAATLVSSSYLQTGGILPTSGGHAYLAVNVVSPPIVSALASGGTVTVIPTTSAAFRYSPGNWSGAVRSTGSGSPHTWNTGAWWSVTWTASTSPTAVMTIVNPGPTSSLAISYTVNGALQGDRIGALNGNINITGITANGSNTAIFYVVASNNSAKWNSGVNSLTLTNFTVDGLSTAGTASTAKPWVLLVGQDATEGWENDPSTPAGPNPVTTLTNNENWLKSYGYILNSNSMSSYDFSFNACAGSGWIVAGDSAGDVPAYYKVTGGTYSSATSRWWQIDQGVTLLDSANQISSNGTVGNTPYLILINLGEAEAISSSSTSDLTASITQGLVALRAAAPAAYIGVVVPFGYYNTTYVSATYVTALKAGVSAYLTAHSGDTKAFLVDLGVTTSTTLTATAGYLYSDGINLLAAGDTYVAPVLNGVLQPLITPAVIAPSGVSGLMAIGFGCQLAYANSAGSISANWAWFTAQFCIPRNMLFYAASFSNEGSITYNIANYGGADWAADSNLNGTNTGKHCIPIMGVTQTTWAGDITFANTATGSQDAFLATIVTGWSAHGWPSIVIRWGYEDEFPTCPSGVNAYWTAPSSGHPDGTGNVPYYVSGTSGALSVQTPWMLSGTGPTYAAIYIPAWRHAAGVFHQIGTANNCKVYVGWGVTMINSASFDPRVFYPDSNTSDGKGSLVDCILPDLYMDNCWGYATYNLWTGYQNNGAFSPIHAKGAAVPSSSAYGNEANLYTSGWSQDVGSRMMYLDFTGGTAGGAIPAKTKTALPWSGGWGTCESYTHALQQGKPIGHPEFGGYFQGGNQASNTYGPFTSIYGGSPGEINGYDGYYGSASGTTDYAFTGAWVRSRANWFSQSALNGIANSQMFHISFWQNQSATTLGGMKAAYPEYVTNPDAGAGAGGVTNALYISTLGAYPINAPITVNFYASYAITLAVISVNLGAGAGAQALLTLAPNATLANNAVVFTFTPTKLGTFPILVTDTSKNISSISENYTVSAPVPANAAIRVAAIPAQTTSQTFSVQVAFDAYIPVQNNILYAQSNSALTYVALPTTSTWTDGGQLLTISLANGVAQPHQFGVQDTTFSPVLQSNISSYTVTAGGGGGGTATVTPPPITATTVATLSISSPGTAQEASLGAGVTLPMTITGQNITFSTVYWAVFQANGTIVGSYASVPLVSQQANISVFFASSGYYVQAVDNTTAATVTGKSSAVVITDAGSVTTTISISAPGTVNLTTGQTSVTITETITTTNLTGNVFWGIYNTANVLQGVINTTTIGTGGITNVQAVFVNNGDYLQAQNLLTSPTVIGKSSAITIVASVVTPSITVSNPGTVTQVAVGAGATVSLSVTAANLVGPLFYSVLTNSGAVELAPTSFTISASGAATITVLMLNTGDTVLVGNAATNPTVTGSSAAITLVTQTSVAPTITVSDPGTIQEATLHAGVTPNLTASTTNLVGGITYSVLTKLNAVETAPAFVLPVGAAIRVAAIPTQTVNQSWATQIAFDNYVPNRSNVQYYNNATVNNPFAALPANVTWDGSGQLLTLPLTNGTQTPHTLRIQDITTATPLQSPIVSYTVSTAGGGGTATVSPTPALPTLPQTFNFSPHMANAGDYVQVVGVPATQTGIFAISNISSTVSAGVYTYSVNLKNVGTVSISTFWFAWVPGYSFLVSLPTASSPAGWTSAIVTGASHYSIQWVATVPLVSGASIIFTFTSIDTPAVLFAPSTLNTAFTVAQSVVFNGTPS